MSPNVNFALAVTTNNKDTYVTMFVEPTSRVKAVTIIQWAFPPTFGINSPSDCEAPVAAGAKHSTTHSRIEVSARHILS